MRNDPEIRLDILIKREDDYYLAHCLQFDIVATDDTVEDVQKGIIDLCIAHIRFSCDNDNLDYLFCPAPQEVWAEYLALAKDPTCHVDLKKIDLPEVGTGESFSLPPFIAQEILSNDVPTRRIEI